MEKNTAKVFILIAMEILIQDGGHLEKNKEKELMFISQLDKE
jgi:hypothetical protein